MVEINNIHFKLNSEGSNPVDTYAVKNVFSSLYEQFRFDNTTISDIKGMARYLSLKLSNDFFDVGDLRTNTFVISGSDSYLKGTYEEKNKYNLIIKLHSLIAGAVNWIPIERAFDEISCFKLALKNNGTAVDEDIEIRINIPKDALIVPNEFPRLNEENIEYLVQELDNKQLFGIKETAEYQSYPFPVQINTYAPESFDFSYIKSVDYKEKYLNFISDVFCFSVFQDTDNYILGLKYDYIKHNTAIAFPMPILLKSEIAKIEYTITSKNNPNIVSGTLEIP